MQRALPNVGSTTIGWPANTSITWSNTASGPATYTSLAAVNALTQRQDAGEAAIEYYGGFQRTKD